MLWGKSKWAVANEDCSGPEAKLASLREQETELHGELTAAEDELDRLCLNKAVPPRNIDSRVIELGRHLEALQVKISQTEAEVTAAQGKEQLARSKAAKPTHDALRRQVIEALEDLRDALDEEERFRYAGDYSSSVITAVYLPGVDVDVVKAMISEQRRML